MTGSRTDFPDDTVDLIDDREEVVQAAQSVRNLWRVLVVDDDPDVHSATRFALGQSAIAGRGLDLISAYSAAEGKQKLEAHPDIAVVLLDVVMEEHDAGLKFVEWMRARGYEKQRIILRTGQPGYAPELDVIRNYDINDYRAKDELTQTRLITAMTAAIRTFEQFWVVEEQRLNLESLAYALAHDFHQTTRQIRTLSDMMRNSYDEDDDTGAPQALTLLVAASHRLSGLINVLSQYTLLSKPIVVESVDVISLLSDVRAGLIPVLKETGGELSAHCDGICHANPAMLSHVLQILAANGLQHNESVTPRVEITTTRHGGDLVFAVRDNGVGIAQSQLDELSKPHRRLRAITELPAIGLGLTLSRRAVEAIGGTIWCESEIGKGSTFRVSLPIAPRVALARSA